MENNLDKTLLKVQKEIIGIVKDNKNPYYNSAYFDVNKVLSVVRPILNKHGLIIAQPTKYDNESGKTLVWTYIIGDGELREANLPLPDIQDPQKLGSCITYYRRYTLVSLLALEALDDDGNAASNKKVKPNASEVSAIIKSGNKEKARKYWQSHDWADSQSLENKLTSHFK